MRELLEELREPAKKTKPKGK